jgi:hypothetical protein
MSEVDSFRLEVMRQISKVPSFTNSWPVFQPQIRALLGSSPTGQSVYDLGAHLGEIFKSKQVTGRSNSAVSQAGVVWECLVAWYMNFVLHGTDVIVVRPLKQFKPKTISDALSVTISNHKTNTEADLIAFSVPTSKKSAVEESLKANLALQEIEQRISNNPQAVDVAVIQCKTNWNDNAQIPMLWDLIYATQTFRIPNVSVGSNGASPSSFNRFAYSFVTVPTSNGPFSAKSLSTLRVANMTGGNYWGRDTMPGVARSIAEFFTTNFASHFNGTVQNAIQVQIAEDPDYVESYVTHSFE